MSLCREDGHPRLVDRSHLSSYESRDLFLSVTSYQVFQGDWATEPHSWLGRKTIAVSQEKGASFVLRCGGTVVLQQHLLLNVLVPPERHQRV